MSEYRKLVEAFLERYEKPVVDEYIQGFSGIDPQRKVLSSEIDHEALSGLLGGAENEHYHLTKTQYEWMIEQISDFLPVIAQGQNINAIAESAIIPYEIIGENIKINL